MGGGGSRSTYEEGWDGDQQLRLGMTGGSSDDWSDDEGDGEWSDSEGDEGWSGNGSDRGWIGEWGVALGAALVA
jgi:hypothetical protein